GAGLETGGEDRRQLEVFGKVGKGQHVVLEPVRFDIANQRQQASLMIDQQNGGVILVETIVRSSHWNIPRFLSMPNRPAWVKPEFVPRLRHWVFVKSRPS